ncbi:hydroxypyruvate isomerase family protein [Microbacterium sp. MPKO10]|uniref:hydroxypyruvate isomerase family protein n=1 Tax=Microbacterium sp. MPKO10 TaxID=2989818 RepID=UPI0022369059|nr:TIM barrel protein [Microbacterium sp. MPKO10]MCW4459811.1 TIM barrel protein [Microbacterium sp. MPKO10]
MTSTIVANVSLLFARVPTAERFGAARAAGFDRVESWWPFATADPSPAEVDAWLRAIDTADVTLTGLNLYAGDMPNGERGVLSHPAREDEFDRSLAVTQRIADATGVDMFNALYGLRVTGVSDETAREVAIGNLKRATEALPDGTMLLEPLSTAANGDAPIASLDDAESIRSAAAASGVGAIGLLFDTFHLAANGLDLVSELQGHAAHIAHVQIADNPGRGAPGTGTIDFPTVLSALAETGYRGGIAAEYAPDDQAVCAADLDRLLELGARSEAVS